MNPGKLLDLADIDHDSVRELLSKKGADYASDIDALANFKEAARRLGVSPTVIWAVYADKHWSAIMAYCRAGQVESEPIEGRILDTMAYLVLLHGLVVEEETSGGYSVPSVGGVQWTDTCLGEPDGRCTYAGPRSDCPTHGAGRNS